MIETIYASGGHQIRIWSSSGAKTVWLLVPGMWHTGLTCFGTWPKFLADRPDTASAVLVLRGHSSTDRDAEDNFSTLSDYVADIRNAFMRLAETFDHIILCGHSMGGLLVHLTTQSLPETVRGKLAAVVTLCESTSVVPRMAFNALTSRSILDILEGQPFKPHPRDIEKYVLRAGWDLDEEPSFGYESGIAARQLLLGQFKLDFTSLARPKVPHLVIGSINDPIVPCSATAKTYHRMIRAGINAHYLTVVPGGHMITHCRAATQTIAKIFAMMNSYIERDKTRATIIQLSDKNQEFAA